MIDAEAASLTSLRGKLGTHKQAPVESMGILRAAWVQKRPKTVAHV